MYLETRGPKSRYLKGRAHPQTCRRPLPASAGIRKPQLSSGRRWPHSSLHGGSLASVFTSSRLFTCLWVQISPLIKGPQSSGPQPVPVASPTPLLPQRAHLRVRPHPQGQESGPQRTLLGTKGNPTPGLGEISPSLKGTQRSVWELGLQRQAQLLHCSGGSPGHTCRGFCPFLGPAGVVPAGQAQPVCRAPRPLLAAAGFHVPVILWVPPQPQDFLCPPHPHPAQDGAPGTNQREAAGEGRGRGSL